MFAIRVTEGDMDAGKFFILQDVADHACDADVGADSELAYAVGVFVAMRVLPEIILQLDVAGGAGNDAVVRDCDGHRCSGERAVTLAQVVADDAVHHEGAVHFAGRGEDLASGQVTPLIRADDAAGLEPLVAGVQLGANIRARCRGGAHRCSFTRTLEDALTQTVYREKVGAHTLKHDLRSDVDHVGVTHAAPIYHVRHLPAGEQLVLLDLYGEDRDLTCLHIGEHLGWHAGEGSS